jgi:type I restriction enzyme R subunit
VADGVNVNYRLYRIRTQLSEAGGKVESGYYADLRDKLTRKVRWEHLDEEFAHHPTILPEQDWSYAVRPEGERHGRRETASSTATWSPWTRFRTLVRTFRDKLFTGIFPGRSVRWEQPRSRR